jgi:hypothetical protein
VMVKGPVNVTTDRNKWELKNVSRYSNVQISMYTLINQGLRLIQCHALQQHWIMAIDFFWPFVLLPRSF